MKKRKAASAAGGAFLGGAIGRKVGIAIGGLAISGFWPGIILGAAVGYAIDSLIEDVASD
jgi:hypothetical protein